MNRPPQSSDILTLSDADRPNGLAMFVSAELDGGRSYMCDVANHSIDVTDLHARPLFSFGGRGSAPGQFESPSDCVIINGDPTGEGVSADPGMLAVADRGNQRIQVFELDGALLGTIESSPWHASLNGWPARSGWPFFRVAPVPQLSLPTRLDWHAPLLDVTMADGSMVHLDVATALLPDFESWLPFASQPTLEQAVDHFSSDARRGEIPDAYLWRIADRLRMRTAPRKRSA